MQPDSLLAVKAVGTVSGFLTSIAPGLNEQMVAWLSKLIASAPIVVAIFANEWVGKKLHDVSPFVEAYLAPLWAKWRWAVNPALGALVGGLGGDSTMGMAAGVLWSMTKGAASQLGNKDLAGVTRAKAIALVLGVLTAAALVSPAGAEEKKPVPLLSQLVIASGGGVRYMESTQTVPFVGLQFGMIPTNHISPRVGVRYLMGDTKSWEGDAGLWLVW